MALMEGSRKSVELPSSSRNASLDQILDVVEAQQLRTRKRSNLLPKETSAEFVQELTNDDEEEREAIRKEAREDEERRRRELAEAETAANSAQTKRPGFKQLSSLTPGEIEDHYNRCIQLCNQNKVNKNNAFKLQLIDCMNLIMKQPKHTSNLTLAGCTLDASAKIYACRVDKVYSDMLMAISGKQNDGADESNQSGEDRGDDEAEHEDEPRKKKKKKNTEEDLDFDKFLMSENDLKKERGRDEDAAFLLKGRSVLPPKVENFMDCPLFGPLCELRLDCRLDYYDDDSTFSQTNPITSICKLSEKTPVDPAKYIPGYKDLRKKFIVIGGDDNAEESMPEVPATLVDKALIFEPSDSLANNHVPFVDEDDAAADAVDYEMDYDACDVEDNSCPSLPVVDGMSLKTNLSKSMGRFSVGGLSRFVAINSSDYSYFDDTKAKFHAAPSHWSLKPKRRRFLHDRCLVPSTAQKTNTKKQNLIDFSVEKLERLKKEFVTKEAPCLSQKTLQSWEKDKLKFSYCSFNAKKLLSFITNNDLLFVDKDLKRSKVAVADENMDDQISGPSIIPEPFHHDSDSDREGDVDGPSSPVRDVESRLSQRLSSVGFEAEPFASCGGLDDLIPAPPKVEQIQVNYARIQKRVDIKGLKTAIWRYLDMDQDKENINAQCDNGTLSHCVAFSDVAKRVPNLVSRDESAQLSVPIMFMAVLHLVNEKNLKLTKLPKAKATDFKIELNDK